MRLPAASLVAVWHIAQPACPEGIRLAVRTKLFVCLPGRYHSNTSRCGPGAKPYSPAYGRADTRHRVKSVAVPDRFRTRPVPYPTGSVPDRFRTRPVPYPTGSVPDRFLARSRPVPAVPAYPTGSGSPVRQRSSNSAAVSARPSGLPACSYPAAMTAEGGGVAVSESGQVGREAVLASRTPSPNPRPQVESASDLGGRNGRKRRRRPRRQAPRAGGGRWWPRLTRS